MKNFLVVLVAIILVGGAWLWVESQRQGAGVSAPSASSSAAQTSGASGASTAAGADVFRTAFEQRQSGLQVKGEAVVSKLLADDNDGSRHQRFILRLPSGQTLLVAHNIDIAPRINALKVGDTVQFYGVYEWNDKGGVVHWTHRDPKGRHTDGWLKHAGKTYR